jgi:hypothetical protein
MGHEHSDRNGSEESDHAEDPIPHTGPLPEAPKLDPKLPKVGPPPNPGGFTPRQYAKMGMAYQAAASFITPFILLPLIGMWLDKKMHWAPWGVIVGFILGMAVGINLLLQIINRLGD